METEFDGYVIYCKDAEKEIPFGVVSEDFECRAESNFIPSDLKKFLVQIEDQRFYEHYGIDFKAITRAFCENIKAGKITQGGSTITQQLARNILKQNNKTISRKLKEIIKAINLEINFSKEEILDLYFNNIYFGGNLRGIRTAGLYYFGKELSRLNQSEILYLLTIIRGPNYYIKRTDIAEKRYKLLNKILQERNLISKNRGKKNLRARIYLKCNQLQTVRNASVPFITHSSDTRSKSLISTIDLKIQIFSKQFVAESKYPVSIIAIRQGKVVGFASSYGTDYPFTFKSNVGSTLKPFLYCFFRDNGITPFEEFNAFNNSLNWKVREVLYLKPLLNLQEALYYSNNNTFLNAASKVGVDSSLKFLSDIFGSPKAEFYPSSILGATRKGISLYELALAYSNFFTTGILTENKNECLAILNRIFYEKIGFNIESAFLKTGTTNNNKERFAVLGDPELTFAVLRNENNIKDNSKEGSFINQISRSFYTFFRDKKNFVWI